MNFKKISDLPVIDALSFLSIFVSLVFFTNGELLETNDNFIYYFPYAICLGALVLEALSKKNLLNEYIIWRILLIVLFFASFIFSINNDSVFFAVKRFTLQTFTVVLVSYKASEREGNINLIMKLFVIATLLNMIYAFLNMDISAFLNGERLGAGTINASWNANDIGLNVVISLLFLVYNLMSKKHKKNAIYYLLILFFGLIVIMSGSKKCILILLMVGMLYLTLSAPKKIFKNIILISVLLIVAFIAITKIPFLYAHIGYRFESMISLFIQDGEADKSTALRDGMIKYGIEFFKRSPIWGYGINCYQDLYGSITGWKVYSHNNFIELLVGTGIIGFLLYYIYPVLIIFRNIKSDKKTFFIKAFLISLIVIDYAIVSYISTTTQVTLCILISAICSRNYIKNEV